MAREFKTLKIQAQYPDNESVATTCCVMHAMPGSWSADQTTGAELLKHAAGL